MASCIIAVSLGRFSVVFLLRKVKKFFVRFMKEIVAIMPGQSPLWPRLLVMDFIGWRLMLMRRIWLVNVTVVRSSRDVLTYRLKS